MIKNEYFIPVFAGVVTVVAIFIVFIFQESPNTESIAELINRICLEHNGVENYEGFTGEIVVSCKDGHIGSIQ